MVHALRAASAAVGSLFRDPTANQAWFAKWIAQADADASGLTMWRVLHDHPEIGELIWQMRDDGRRLRRYAAHDLYRGDGLDLTPDSDHQCAYGPQKVLGMVLRKMRIETKPATEANGGLDVLEHYTSPITGEACYALIQTYSGGRAPTLLVDLNAPSYTWDTLDGYTVTFPRWLFDAACCVGKLFKESGLYLSRASVADRIVPPDPARETLTAVPLHMFAKALLGLGTYCSPHFDGCTCNRVIERLNQAPPDAFGVPREATGVMLFPSVRSSYRDHPPEAYAVQDTPTHQLTPRPSEAPQRPIPFRPASGPASGPPGPMHPPHPQEHPRAAQHTPPPTPPTPPSAPPGTSGPVTRRLRDEDLLPPGFDAFGLPPDPRDE